MVTEAVSLKPHWSLCVQKQSPATLEKCQGFRCMKENVLELNTRKHLSNYKESDKLLYNMPKNMHLNDRLLRSLGGRGNNTFIDVMQEVG